jgi:hypothetical protein
LELAAMTMRAGERGEAERIRETGLVPMVPDESAQRPAPR